MPQYGGPLNRRRLFGLAAAAGFAGAAPAVWAAPAGGPKRLVVAMLRGAVDGLSVVVPYREDAYYAARPSIAIGRPGTEGGGLDLDGQFALHPGLAALMPLWQRNQLAFVHAAGSPDPTRSHFDAQLFIENGTPGRQGTQDGWMNRLLAAMPGPHGPTDAVAVGPTLPQILRGAQVAANLPLAPAASQALPIDMPAVAAGFDRLYTGNDSIGRSYRQGRAARTELLASINAEQEAADAGAPPPNTLPAQAGRLAHLLAHDERVRLVFLSLGGWDTHVAQGNHTGQLAGRLLPLGQGLAAFAQELRRAWEDTVVVVVSEFGRTVRENGDRGTDHGHGNVMWIAGGSVRGGRVYGEWPGLAPAQLYEGRDLAVTTDYRNVLASVAARHLRLADKALDRVFPGLPPARPDLAQLLAT